MIKPIIQLKKSDYKHKETLLRQRSEPVNEIGPHSDQIFRDLTDTIEAHNIAVGLSAVQIGYASRIFVVDTRKIAAMPGERVPEFGVIGLINPKVVRFGARTDIQFEACMSIPSVQGAVERPLKIIVEHTTPEGKPMRLVARNFFARVILHELDHLDGILYIDRMPPDGKLFPADFSDQVSS